jgi:hypothetical protein
VHQAHSLAQFSLVLPLLQILEKIAPRPFLTMSQGLEHTMFLEQPSNLSQALLESCFRANGRHAPSYPQEGVRRSTLPAVYIPVARRHEPGRRLSVSGIPEKIGLNRLTMGPRIGSK